MVTRQNITDIGAVYDFLCAQKVVDVWRLYQFSPYGIGRRHQDRFEIPESEFRKATTTIKKRHDDSGFVISERSRTDNAGYCMIMDSGGSFYRYEENYIPLGVTIFDRIEDVVKRYDQKKHQRQKRWQR